MVNQSGYSRSTIRRMIDQWIVHPPRHEEDLSSYKYTVMDGTYFEARRGMFCAMDGETNRILDGVLNIAEKQNDLCAFFTYLSRRGLTPEYAVIDGNPAVIKALRKIWPEIQIQRCLVHIQRQGLRWCRRFPKSMRGKQLRKIFLRVTNIQTLSQQRDFLEQVHDWECRYGASLAKLPEKGWVMSDLIRARSMLLTALPDMFHYLQDPKIPYSTNALEGYFGRLKKKYRQHHGFTGHRQINYLRWYLYLCTK
jgi:transposase-like protein